MSRGKRVARVRRVWGVERVGKGRCWILVEVRFEYRGSRIVKTERRRLETGRSYSKRVFFYVVLPAAYCKLPPGRYCVQESRLHTMPSFLRRPARAPRGLPPPPLFVVGHAEFGCGMVRRVRGGYREPFRRFCTFGRVKIGIRRCLQKKAGAIRESPLQKQPYFSIRLRTGV